MDEKNDDREITQQTKKRVIQSFDFGNKKKDTLLNHQSKTTAVVENKELVEEAVTQNFIKFSRVPYGTKIVEDETERKSVRKKLIMYTVLDALIAIVILFWITRDYFGTCDVQYNDKRDVGQEFTLFVIITAPLLTVSLICDALSLYLIRRGRINAIVWLIAQVIDLGMLILSIWNLEIWAFHG
jgi:hypothetical protein